MAIRLQIETVPSVCTGCRLCEIACSLHRVGEVNPELSRVWVTDDWDYGIYNPHICQMCVPPHCVDACPTEALTQRGDTLVITVADELCNGCLACVAACPHEAIRWSEHRERILVCDRCGGDPACLPFCHRGALASTQIGTS